jgi:hypothetical protein
VDAWETGRVYVIQAVMTSAMRSHGHATLY